MVNSTLGSTVVSAISSGVGSVYQVHENPKILKYMYEYTFRLLDLTEKDATLAKVPEHKTKDRILLSINDIIELYQNKNIREMILLKHAYDITQLKDFVPEDTTVEIIINKQNTIGV